jgi:predicted dehydrogenase
MRTKNRPVNIGIIGCGNISGIYLKNCPTFQNLEVVAVADIDRQRAEAKAAEHGLQAFSVSEMLAHPEIELVVNLTIPKAHAEVNQAIIAAGKHAYCEKPLAVNAVDGQDTLRLAKAGGVRLGCAPDTVLGSGIQTCRKLIDEGAIGKIVGATAFMTTPGHERWHPDPEFYYKQGGGPMFDMGPYYLTALVQLLGPITRVTGSTRITHAQRTITSQPKYGQTIEVETPTHFAGVLDFANGAVGMILQSFDIWAADLPRIEIYGSEGTLSVPDPNTFGGPVKLFTSKEKQWREIALTHGHSENTRGLGVADMAAAIRSGRAHRANGDVAFHVLEVMAAFEQASSQGRHVVIESSVERPAPLPAGLKAGEIDA